MKLNRTLLLGFLAGLAAAAFVVVLIHAQRSSEADGILAKMDGAALSERELRDRLANDLIPIENDEYRVLSNGLNDWIHSQLFEKEAKARGLTLKDLYLKELWGRVEVSYDDIWQTYQQNKAAYGGQPFEKASAPIASQVRNEKYLRVREEYLEGLRKKYHVEAYLKRPKSFIEGLAVPRIVPSKEKEGPKETAPSGPPRVAAAVAVPETAPSLGPTDAPITLSEFSDFHCPFCKKAAPILKRVFEHYPGKIRWVFRHYPLSQTPGSGSFLTHEASACAHEQGKFWEFHDEIFSLSALPQEADLKNLSGKVGLDTEKFQACLQGKRYQGKIQQDRAEGSQLGVRGTPTIFVNDQTVGGAYPFEYFVGVIDAILSGKAPPPSPRPTPKPVPSIPPTALRFDDLEGRPSLGPKEAQVTIVEFSDFYCPFCKRVTPTLEQLMKNYKGKLRRVWRHYPLSFHAGADRAHQASECAHEQGKFWIYHDKLFEVQGTQLNDDALIKLAKEAGLDKKRFEKCLSSGKYKELIQKEISRGNEAGVQGTPAFFINGQAVSGAQPYENFDQIVKSKLAK